MSSTTFENINFQNNYKLWEYLELSVSVDRSYYGLKPEALFEMGLRVNKKRQFLFISKLIAKHLAVHPAIALGTGSLLSSLLMENAGLKPHPDAKRIAEMIDRGEPDTDLMQGALQYKKALPAKTVFIGMAETATGLGHATFQHFHGADYIHTTREAITGSEPSFVFEEEHSHATSHKVFAPEGMLEEAETIVLVDDEISTGNTLINLVEALDDQFPGKCYKCLSILDWRNSTQRLKMDEFTARRGIQADVLSLMSGEFILHHGQSPEDVAADKLTGGTDATPKEVMTETVARSSATDQRYIPFTGRFGLSSTKQQELEQWIETAAAKTVPLLAGEKALVIGIGENMYVPLRFGLALGGDVKVQTTTRSPIHAARTPGYPIQEKASFQLPDMGSVDQYIYNLGQVEVDRIYLIAESVIQREEWLPLVSYLEEKAPIEWISLTN